MKNRLHRCPISRASSSASDRRLTRSLSGCNCIAVIDLIVLCVIIAYPPYRRASAKERLKTDVRTWVSYGGLHTARPYREKNKILYLRNEFPIDSKFKYLLFYFYFNYRAVIILYYMPNVVVARPADPQQQSVMLNILIQFIQ